MSDYRIRWELEYPDGRVLREHPEGSRIGEAPRGAKSLRIISDNQPLQEWDLTQSGGWLPVFYRVKGVNVCTHKVEYKGVLVSMSEPTVDAIVFGMARDTDKQIDVRILAIFDGRIRQVPERYIDRIRIEMQVVPVHGSVE